MTLAKQKNTCTMKPKEKKILVWEDFRFRKFSCQKKKWYFTLAVHLNVTRRRFFFFAPLQKSRRNHRLICEQKFYPVWFLCRRQGYQLLCEYGLNHPNQTFLNHHDFVAGILLLVTESVYYHYHYHYHYYYYYHSLFNFLLDALLIPNAVVVSGSITILIHSLL